MSEAQFDFAVFGASPLAGLVAGLLASRHGRRVVVVGEAQALYRLPRMLDLSVAPITRPETWSLLVSVQPETTRLVGKIGGRGAIRHVDPIFFADGEAAREALGHITHMARGFGLILENVPPVRLGLGRTAFRMLDAVTINRPAFEPALESWLSRSGVRRLMPEAVTMEAGGGAEMLVHGEMIRAGRAVLVDDAAILSYLPARFWPGELMRQPASTILAASERHLAGPIMFELDNGTVLVEHEEGGMAAIGPGTLGSFSQHLATLLVEAGGQLQQAGQVGFETVVAGDGAPLVGPTSVDGPTLLTGLGPIGAFLAPVLARWLCGEANAEEAQWCEMRRPDRRGLGRAVADFRSLGEERAA